MKNKYDIGPSGLLVPFLLKHHPGLQPRHVADFILPTAWIRHAVLERVKENGLPKKIKDMVDAHWREGLDQISYLAFPSIDDFFQDGRVRMVGVLIPHSISELVPLIESCSGSELMVEDACASCGTAELMTTLEPLERFYRPANRLTTVTPAIVEQNPTSRRGKLPPGRLRKNARKMLATYGYGDVVVVDCRFSRHADLQLGTVGVDDIRLDANLEEKYRATDRVWHLEIDLDKPITGIVSLAFAKLRGFGLFVKNEISSGPSETA